MNYKGRFAPSPSAPLHFGSLIAALASYLQARSNRGKWLVRIEDVDIPRSIPGTDKIILNTLEALHLHWDEEVIYQSHREQQYETIRNKLDDLNYLYPCTCTRKEIGPNPYPGTCKNGISSKTKPTSIRLKVDTLKLSFTDRIQGIFEQQLDTDVGDFIVKRSDGMTSYNLAVVSDDADQEITEIVRGTDLLDSTPRQIYIQQLLGFKTPSYLHFPVASDKSGRKLSKQNHAPEINITNAAMLILDALNFLGQRPPTELAGASIEEIVQWGIDHWSLEAIPRTDKIYYKIN